MATLNSIFAEHPRQIVLEAMYLASHELTCSTRMGVENVLQNKSLDRTQAAAAIALAEEVVVWFAENEGKPIGEFEAKDRTALAQKLSGYRLHHLVDRSQSVQDEVRRLRDSWDAEAA